jgi:dTMP kinase
MNMKYQAVIFDMDGTISESAPGILGGIAYALNTMGRPLPEEKVLRRFLGPPLMECFIAYCGMSPREAEEAQSLYRDYYFRTGFFENTVYPGVRHLLYSLRQAGATLAIASHKPEASLRHILEAFDLLRYFDDIAGPGEGEAPGKAELIRRANPRGLKAVMIGDRGSDMIAAREAGAFSIAVSYGYGEEEEFVSAGAGAIAGSVDELYTLVGLQKTPQKGYFISFEGNDGSGKSTQAKLLSARLIQNGYDVLLTREPGGTRVGEIIRELVLDRENIDIDSMTEAMLYAAARAQHVRQVILPALEKGRVVISDRFVDSSIAYQGAGRGLGMDLVRQINDPAIAGRLPDATVFISLNPDEGIRRRSRAREMDRLEQEGLDFHRRVSDAFNMLSAGNPRFITVASHQDKYETAAIIYDEVTKRLHADGLP